MDEPHPLRHDVDVAEEALRQLQDLWRRARELRENNHNHAVMIATEAVKLDTWIRETFGAMCIKIAKERTNR